MAMNNRTRAVLEIGVGTMAKKLVALAIKHPEVEFTGMDRKRVKYGRELLEHGLIEKPKNLRIAQRTDALELLKRQRDDYYSHVFTHFVLQHMSHSNRRELYQHVFRTMQPNALFTILEQTPYKTQLEKELRDAGFSVRTKRITTENARTIDSEHIGYNVKGQRLAEYLIDKFGLDSQEVREGNDEIIRERMRRIEGTRPTPEVHSAIERMAHAGHFVRGKTPFTLIYAKKPREIVK